MKRNRANRFWHLVVWVSGIAALALLTFVCFRFHANSTTVALLYLIVIILLSLRASFVPSALVAIIAYICLDYFFTAPLFTLGMSQTLDFVAPIAYVTTALVITRLMSRVRKSTEDQRRAEEALRRAQAEMAHITRVMTMGELAASIAHEINQPLSAIVNSGSACVRWLAGDSPNLDEAREAAQDIIREGTRAGEVITRIRAFLRKTETEKAPIDINQTIRDVVILMRNEAEGKGASLHMELAANLPAVLGDRVQLQQVVLNLVMNGIEAMASVTDRPRELRIQSSQYESDKVLVAVQDSGVGLAQADLEEIFDAFYTTKAKGLGMGLAISRSIVEGHGGQLWVQPNDGSGTTFQFTLLKHH
ncbi:MAG TPA: ATP-binding protein [Pyrinomonadaceae bacterium]|jgi:C4-dicarboxylate-specific signal transduction histidine kinase